jgi:hypothetical protein
MQDVSRRSLLAAAGGLSLASLMGSALAQGKIKPGPDTVLVVVDVQNCSCPEAASRSPRATRSSR